MSDNKSPELSPEEREQFKNLQNLFSIPEVATFLKRHLSGSLQSVDVLPRGWTGGSNAPYYKEKYGMQVKPVIDRMIETGKPQLIPYADCGYTFHTLNALINQGWLWLIDNKETPDGAYKNWRLKVSINKTPNGIALYIKEKPSEDLILPFVEIDGSLEAGKWRTEMQEFLDSAPPKATFKRIGLNLLIEEQDDLKLSLSQLDTIVFVVEANKLIIAKKP